MRAKLYDLSQAMSMEMPRPGFMPPFMVTQVSSHGLRVRPGNVTSATELVVMGSHMGTHMDCLNHFAVNHRFHNGESSLDGQKGLGGLIGLDASSLRVQMRRGVLIDLTRYYGKSVLDGDYPIGPEALQAALQLQKTEIHPGDVALLRTGFDLLWHQNPARYVDRAAGIPGATLAGARWLADQGVWAVGSDTFPFEYASGTVMGEVHPYLLVERGIHIVENLNLAELSRDEHWEFDLLIPPVRIAGTSAALVCPVAFV